MRMKSLIAIIWKAFPWGLALFFALACGRLIYGAIDQAVTLDNRNQQCLLIQKQRDVLRLVADSMVKRTTKTELLGLLERHDIQYFPKEENGKTSEIVADQVVFCFENSSLVRIEANDGDSDR